MTTADIIFVLICYAIVVAAALAPIGRHRPHPRQLGIEPENPSGLSSFPVL
jgi:hypothetical protein